MDAESPEINQAMGATQNAMKLLKQNPSPEENNGASSTSGEQEKELGRFGEELAPEAEIWKMYYEEAQTLFWQELGSVQRSLEALMWFAVSFSAILALFLLEARRMLRQNLPDAYNTPPLPTDQLHQHIEPGLPAFSELNKPITTSEYTPTTARWINRAWVMSLALSLSITLLARLGNEGLSRFNLPRPDSMNTLARVRYSISRIVQLEESGALHTMDILSTLLHTSLLLFTIGLVVYVWEFDTILAVVLVGIIGITLSLYFGTSALAVTSKQRDFTTEVTRCIQRAVSTLFRASNRNADNEAATPSILDLQALFWLSKRPTDPSIVESAYQAMAGLHQSPYTVPDLQHRRPSPSMHPMVPMVCQGEAIDSLFSHVAGRYDKLLDGTLEPGPGEEPPACRYINAMIALGYFRNSPKDGSLMIWLDIWDRIGRLWNSDLPQHSLSGNNFAGVLIAEMDVLKLIMKQIQLNLPTLEPDPAQDADVDSGPAVLRENKDLHEQPRSSPTSELTPQLDKPASDLLLKVFNRLEDWLEVLLTLLDDHLAGELSIDTYLVDGLFRAMSDGAYFLKRIYAVLVSKGLIYLIPDTQAGRHEPLRLLTFHLFRRNSLGQELIMRQTQLLKTYSYFAPVQLHLLKPQDTFGSNDKPDVLTFDPNSLTTYRGILVACIQYMIPLAASLSDLLLQFPQYRIVFENAVVLLEHSTVRDPSGDDDAPRQAVRRHINQYIKILEFIWANQPNIEPVSFCLARALCHLSAQSVDEAIHPIGFYLSSSCFLVLIRLFARSIMDAKEDVRLFTRMIVRRLRNPSVSIAQLPPQSSPIPEPSPSIEYLQQFTRTSDGFSSLAQAGWVNDDYIKPVSRAIADITIIAANHDPALAVNPVELQAPAVPGFLEALTWTLPHLVTTAREEIQYKRFIVSASILLVAACDDTESRDLIGNSVGRIRLLEKLRGDKNALVEVVGEEEWQRLVDGLSFGQGFIELPDIGDESDQETEAGPVLNPGEGSETNQDSDSDAGSDLFEFL